MNSTVEETSVATTQSTHEGYKDESKKRLTLYEMRKITGISGAAVARACDTSYQTLRNWESGATIPNVVNIHTLLSIYGYAFDCVDLTIYNSASKYRNEKRDLLKGQNL